MRRSMRVWKFFSSVARIKVRQSLCDEGPYARFFQRAFAAFLAIDVRFAAESFAARALPPFSPPKRPRVTAARFFFEPFRPLVVSAAV